MLVLMGSNRDQMYKTILTLKNYLALDLNSVEVQKLCCRDRGQSTA